MCIAPQKIKVKDSLVPLYGRYMDVACGKCPECLSIRRREWAMRIGHEQRYNDSTWFVTLTYDEDHLPIFKGLPTLCKEDVQKFLKRYRNEFRSGSVRYYFAGEYGDHGSRPHYHGIIFHKDTLTFKEIDDAIKKTWTSGIYTVTVCNDARAMYTTKYMNKNIYTGEQLPEGVLPPFNLMSRNPGLGEQFCENSANKQFYNNLKKSIIYETNGAIRKMPRYYRGKLLDDEAAAEASLHARAYAADKFSRVFEDWMRRHPGADKHDFYKNQIEQAKAKVRRHVEKVSRKENNFVL